MKNNRYCVIMCGGAGSRFWPFSRAAKPKQFLDFLGTGRTLLQMTVDRIRPLVSTDRVILVTNAAYADIVREQLPEIPAANILTEPARRNTAPCICWAAHHIAAIDPGATIMTLSSDHLVLKEESFVHALDTACTFAETHDALVTLGIKPTAPKTGYGYIQKGALTSTENVMKVKSFTEKPNREMAEIFLQSGEFFWNSGIFIWTARTILDAFRRLAPETASLFDAGNAFYATPAEADFIAEAFPRAANISIDYAIMEKADNVYVETVDLGWSDLGTWQSLYEVSPHNADGNVMQNCKVLAQDCSGTLFAVKGDKIVVAAGLKDYIVSDNGNALLIYPLEREQQVRQAVNEISTRFGEEYL